MKDEVSKEEKNKQELHSVIPESIYEVVENRQANTYDAFSKREKNKEYGFMINHTKKNGRTYAQGFQLTFENGWTISVQFGEYNYCSNQVGKLDLRRKNHGLFLCSLTAETAIRGSDGKFFPVPEFEGGEPNDVQGHQTLEQVVDRINYVRNLKPFNNKEKK